MHEYNFFYLWKIGFYILAIALDPGMMAWTLNVTIPILHPYRLDYDRWRNYFLWWVQCSNTISRNTIFVTKSKIVFPNYRFAHWFDTWKYQNVILKSFTAMYLSPWLLRYVYIVNIILFSLFEITRGMMITYLVFIYGFQAMRIEDTPIKDISDGTFDGSLAESLEELYLINTWLTRVPPAIKASKNVCHIKSDILNNLEMICHIISYFNFHFRI